MAYRFATASAQGLYSNTPPVTTVPLSTQAFVKPTNVTAVHGVLSLTDKDTNDTDYYGLWLLGSVGGDPVWAANKGGGVFAQANGPSAFTTAWQQVGAKHTSRTSRNAIRNGALGTTETTDSLPIAANIDSISIGFTRFSSPPTNAHYSDQDLMYPAVWDAVLTDTSWAQLAAWRHPRNVQASDLVALWTLQTNGALTDEISSNVLTAQNAPTWVTNICRICTYAGINPTEVDEDTAYDLEGLGFNDVQGDGVIVLSNNATKGAGTEVEQTINSWADDIINWTPDIGALSEGALFLFVVNSNDEVSPAFSITVNEAAATTVRPRHLLTLGVGS